MANQAPARAELPAAITTTSHRREVMRKFIIERDIPEVGSLERERLRAAAQKSNEVREQHGANIQWVESYVAEDKTFCAYYAVDEDIFHRHVELSGFPATKVTAIGKMISPTTAA